MPQEGHLRVGQGADEAGVSVQTLYYYERRGLLRPPQRTPSGYRIYTADTLNTLRGIRRAKALGFTLKEIRQLMTIESRRSPDAFLEVLAGKMREIDDKIQDLRRIRRSLQEGAESCKCSGDLSRCNALAGLGSK